MTLAQVEQYEMSANKMKTGRAADLQGARAAYIDQPNDQKQLSKILTEQMDCR